MGQVIISSRAKGKDEEEQKEEEKEEEEENEPSSFGSANTIMSSGKTSGIPPTRVETTSKPHEAASTSAVPNASVRDVLRKI